MLSARLIDRLASSLPPSLQSTPLKGERFAPWVDQKTAVLSLWYLLLAEFPCLFPHSPQIKGNPSNEYHSGRKPCSVYSFRSEAPYCAEGLLESSYESSAHLHLATPPTNFHPANSTCHASPPTPAHPQPRPLKGAPPRRLPRLQQPALSSLGPPNQQQHQQRVVRTQAQPQLEQLMEEQQRL